MKINVTEEDIQNGARNSAYSCPVALALTRVGVKGVCVGDAEIETDNDCMTTPKKVAIFIYHFDSGKPVKPFSFEWKPR